MMHNHKHMSNCSFKIFRVVLAIRDLFHPPKKMLSNIDEIRPGARVLDFGCGPGSYSLIAAQMVGSTGKVYAVDSNPFAINEVMRKANEKGITNLFTILTDSYTRLADESIDVILTIYVLHEFKDPGLIIKELERILKSTGILVVKDNKLVNDKVISMITNASENLKLRRTSNSELKKKNKEILFFYKE